MCPRIETRRLVLRAHTADDLPALAASWADPEVVRHITGKVSSLHESWSRLLRYRGLWTVLGYGYWCVCRKDDGLYVGDVGFADWRRATEPSIGGAPEAGWVLARSAHGQGFGGEAVAAAFAWLDRHIRPDRVVSLISEENAASVRIAARNGFRPAGSVTMNGEDVPLWSRPAT